MERYPVLGLILRFGTIGAVVLAVLAAVLAACLSWGVLGWLAPVLGIVLGGLVYVLGKSYVEMVTIVTEMLVPR